MNDDESAVDILYAQVKLGDGSNRPQLFVDRFMSELGQRIPDFMKQQQERHNVKLHATIMNSKFKTDIVTTGDPSVLKIRNLVGWRRESFDARTVLKGCRDYDFGYTVFNKLHVHLSKREEYGPDGH